MQQDSIKRQFKKFKSYDAFCTNYKRDSSRPDTKIIPTYAISPLKVFTFRGDIFMTTNKMLLEMYTLIVQEILILNMKIIKVYFYLLFDMFSNN